MSSRVPPPSLEPFVNLVNHSYNTVNYYQIYLNVLHLRIVLDDKFVGFIKQGVYRHTINLYRVTWENKYLLAEVNIWECREEADN